MTFEKESIRNRFLIEADQNGKKINIYGFGFEYVDGTHSGWDYKEYQKYQIAIAKSITEKYDILSILEENKEIFHLTDYPHKDCEYDFKYDQLYSFLKKDGIYCSEEYFKDKDDMYYYNSQETVIVALFKYLSELDVEGSFDMPGKFDNSNHITFYFNEDKEAALNLEDRLYNFFDEIEPRVNGYKCEVKYEKETLAPTKFSHTDYFGNDIRIGDKGVGCSGRGRTSGLYETQILSMTKVFINGDIRPENFIVLEAIDGRPLKGVRI